MRKEQVSVVKASIPWPYSNYSGNQQDPTMIRNYTTNFLIKIIFSQGLVAQETFFLEIVPKKKHFLSLALILLTKSGKKRELRDLLCSHIDSCLFKPYIFLLRAFFHRQTEFNTNTQRNKNIIHLKQGDREAT